MADEKEVENEQKVAKRRLPPIVLVLVGAALGGAGVVLLAPKPSAETHGPPPAVVKLFDNPDPMSFTINPRVDRGHKTALITFLFSYRANEKDVHDPHANSAEGGGGEHGGGGDVIDTKEYPVPARIRLNWNRAYSRCLEVLSQQPVERLLDPDGKQEVKRQLIDELTATLFPNGIAKVEDILWTKFVVQ